MSDDEITSLPTTPGSMVTFEHYEPAEDETYTFVAALIPGHIDEHGVIHAAVWASAEIDDPEDPSCTFEPGAILAGNPKLLVETGPADPKGEHPEGLKEGTVIRVTGTDGIPQTYTFAPAYFHNGEPHDFFWTNSYGGFLSAGDIDEAEVLYTPRHRA